MNIDICVHCAYIFLESKAFSRFLTRNRNSSATWKRECIIHIHPNLISASDPPAMMAFEGPLPSLASPPAPSAETALFIVTSHLCMNPRDSIVTNTWRTTFRREGALRAFGAEVGGGVNGGGVIGPKRKSMTRLCLAGSVRPSRRLLKARLPFLSCF